MPKQILDDMTAKDIRETLERTTRFAANLDPKAGACFALMSGIVGLLETLPDEIEAQLFLMHIAYLAGKSHAKESPGQVDQHPVG